MNFFSLVTAVLQAIGDVLTLNVSALLTRGADAPVVVGVALVAGFSTMAGYAVVFFLNRVRGVRFHVSMALGTAYLIFLQCLTAVIAVLVCLIVIGEFAPLTVISGYLLALAPRALGFLVFIPHFGLAIGRILEGWVLLALVAVLRGVLDTTWLQAFAIASIAWLLEQILSRALARPVASLASRAWTLATGQPTFLSAHDILAGAPFIPLQARRRTARIES